MGDILAVKITRDVTPEECRWLRETVRAGEILYVYPGFTYGVIGSGMPLTREPGETPFFEVPRDAIGPVA